MDSLERGGRICLSLSSLDTDRVRVEDNAQDIYIGMTSVRE